MSISESDVQRISEAVIEKVVGLVESGGLTSEEHTQHHRAVAIWIERSNRRSVLLERLKEQVGGWSIIVMLGFIGYAVWNAFLKAVNTLS